MSQLVLPQARLSLPNTTTRQKHWGCVRGCAAALGLSELVITQTGFTLVITPTVTDAENLAAELNFFRPDNVEVALFPDLEILPYDSFSPHQDLVAERLRILRRLIVDEPLILLAAAPSLLPRLPPRVIYAHAAFVFRPDNNSMSPSFADNSMKRAISALRR